MMNEIFVFTVLTLRWSQEPQTKRLRQSSLNRKHFMSYEELTRAHMLTRTWTLPYSHHTLSYLCGDGYYLHNLAF